MRHRSLMVLGWLGVAVFARIDAVHGARRENVVGHQNTGSRDSGGALENYTVESLQRFFFSSATSDLSPAEKTPLRHLLAHFRRPDQFIIELRGYMDGAESRENNPALSLQRAEAIARFLSASGIPSQSIRTMGLGEIEGGPANNPEHRRVDVRIFVHPAADPRPHGPSTTGLDK